MCHLASILPVNLSTYHSVPFCPFLSLSASLYTWQQWLSLTLILLSWSRQGSWNDLRMIWEVRVESDTHSKKRSASSELNSSCWESLLDLFLLRMTPMIVYWLTPLSFLCKLVPSVQSSKTWLTHWLTARTITASLLSEITSSCCCCCDRLLLFPDSLHQFDNSTIDSFPQEYNSGDDLRSQMSK